MTHFYIVSIVHELCKEKYARGGRVGLSLEIKLQFCQNQVLVKTIKALGLPSISSPTMYVIVL